MTKRITNQNMLIDDDESQINNQGDDAKSITLNKRRTRPVKPVEQKESSDKLTFSSVVSNSHISKRKRMRFNSKIDMKDPFIVRRTQLKIKQAKLVGEIVKNRLNKERFSYMLSHLPLTTEREEMQKVSNLLILYS